MATAKHPTLRRKIKEFVEVNCDVNGCEVDTIRFVCVIAKCDRHTLWLSQAEAFPCQMSDFASYMQFVVRLFLRESNRDVLRSGGPTVLFGIASKTVEEGISIQLSASAGHVFFRASFKFLSR